MTKITEKQIVKALKTIKINKKNGKKQDIISVGFVASIKINGGDISFILDTGMQDKNFTQQLAKACEKEISLIKNVDNVNIIATAEQSAPTSPRKAAPTPKKLQGVKKIIAIAAGKGGVGKSTIASNLAVTLANQGYSTGIVDTDIFGPSIGKMFNLTEKPVIIDDKMIPPISHGVKAMSISLLVDENTATVWRGSMAVKALYQLIGGTNWADESGKELDFLIVDLPPGTSDIHLSIAQNFILDGVILVSTPQDVALIDVQKALDMLHKMNIPTIGIIENMSYFTDPISQNKNYIFGKGGVDKFCSDNNIQKLAELPILPDIATSGDAGTPISLENREIADIFIEVSSKVFFSSSSAYKAGDPEV